MTNSQPTSANMAGAVSPVYAPEACSDTFCAPKLTPLPASRSPTCAKYGNGGQTNRRTDSDAGAPATMALTSSALAAESPFIFQFPATRS